MSRAALASCLLASLLAASVTAAPTEAAPTFHDCKLLHNFGKIVIVAYCPADISPGEIASLVQVTKRVWLAKYGFVQYRIFSTDKDLPRTFDELMAKSDAWFKKYELASALINSRTGHKDFWCKKTPNDKLTDCTALLQ